MKSEHISIEKWGKDHWSTFAYLETVIVGRQGVIETKRMRTGYEYPTRLKDAEIPNHDDWSCVDDMEAAGLVIYIQPSAVKFTDLGFKVAGQLRRHKAEGGNFKEFQPSGVSV